MEDLLVKYKVYGYLITACVVVPSGRTPELPIFLPGVVLLLNNNPIVAGAHMPNRAYSSNGVC